MASVSGLSRDQRIRCRDRVVQAGKVALAHQPQVHYTQGAKRWEGIDKRLSAKLGKFPTQADCSSFATWCLWNGLVLLYGLGDNVNGSGWRAGYTGTMLEHGKRVRHSSNALRGDCVFYGSGHPGSHVAIVVGMLNGVPMVISHGSRAAPFYVRFDYRSDILELRRYI